MLPNKSLEWLSAPGHPDDEIRAEDVQRAGQCVEKLAEIHVTLDVADGFHVHGAVDRGGGAGGRADVDRVGEHTGVGLQQAVGAVALVGIGIDDHDADAGSFFLQVTHGDGDVVKHAECLAAPFEGMVGAASEADGDTFRECRMAGKAGGLRLGGAAREQAGGGGQAERELLAEVERTVVNLRQVFAVVDAPQHVQVSLGNVDDFLWFQDAVVQQHVPAGRILVTGERVVLREVQVEVEI